MADGGKSDDGMLKEKRACNPDVRPASVLGVATRGEERAEKKVRRMGRKIRQKRMRIKRGGCILGMADGGAARGAVEIREIQFNKNKDK